jgi:SAM-dependent methyltransferase
MAAPAPIDAQSAPAASAPSGSETWNRILGYVAGNSAAWIIDVGLRSGLFRALEDAHPSGFAVHELARTLGFDERLVAAWCRGAYAFELIDLNETGGYRLPADEARILLDPGDPQYLGGRVRFYTALHEDFRAYPQLLSTGAVWPRSSHDPELLLALADLSRPDAVSLANHVVPQVPRARDRLLAGGALLEIGSGSGHHLAHYANEFPTARIVGLEIDPASLDLAREHLAAAGLGARVELRPGDANELADVDSFDLVVMNITLHETGGPDAWSNVLQRTHRALRPGGAVIVSELPYPDRVSDYRESPVYRMLAGVQLHEAVVGCGSITQGELRTLVEQAGFADVRVADQPIRARYVVLGDRA